MPLPPSLQVAINNEVLMAVSNANLANPGGMLEMWVRNVRAAGVHNAMVVALDDETQRQLTAWGFPSFRMDVKVGGPMGGRMGG